MGRILIAGAGPAGLAAAVWAVRVGLEPWVLERSTEVGGQLSSYTLPIVDLPGFGPAPASELIHHFRRELDRIQVRVQYGAGVESWDGERLILQDGSTLRGETFFYAPGLRSRMLGIPGEELTSAASMSELARQAPGRVLVVGGGDRAVEGAIRLAEAGHQVTVALRSEKMRARREYRERLDKTSAVVLTNVSPRRLDWGSGHLIMSWEQGKAWEGDQVLVRIGMEPAVHPSIALVHQDRAFPRMLNMAVIGDAALASWERSLVTSFASAMRAVKSYVQRREP